MRPIAVLILVFALAAPSSGLSSPLDRYDLKERWTCYSALDSSRETILFILEWWTPPEVGGVELGKVLLASSGEEIGLFEFEGDNRRWSYDLDDNNHLRKAVIVRPDGDAKYYDFANAARGEFVQPSQSLFCMESGPDFAQ